MAHYLNQAEYMRWLHRYRIQVRNFIRHLDVIQDQINYATEEQLQRHPGLREDIEMMIDDVEVKLTEADPRDFSNEARPLQGSELFYENFKILVNMIYKLLNKTSPFRSIYETERNRVKQIHDRYHFKDKLNKIQSSVDILLQPVRTTEAVPMENAKNY